MNHYLYKAGFGIKYSILIFLLGCTGLMLIQVYQNKIEYQKYETNLNAISQDIIKILQKDPEIHGLSKDSLIDEQDNHCGLTKGHSTCVQKFKSIQSITSKIPSEIWFYRCQFSKGDIFIRQKRHHFSAGRHRYEFFVPLLQEDSKNLNWIEYDQNRDSGFEIECYPWEEE